MSATRQCRRLQVTSKCKLLPQWWRSQALLFLRGTRSPPPCFVHPSSVACVSMCQSMHIISINCKPLSARLLNIQIQSSRLSPYFRPLPPAHTADRLPPSTPKRAPPRDAFRKTREIGACACLLLAKKRCSSVVTTPHVVSQPYRCLGSVPRL